MKLMSILTIQTIETILMMLTTMMMTRFYLIRLTVLIWRQRMIAWTIRTQWMQRIATRSMMTVTQLIDSDEEDLCIGLTQNECGAIVRDDGDAECAFNTVTGDCYDIERREGRMGSGNFDDGYNTAREQ